ncbi:MAG: fumarylacetoacetate hydrolase family protein [Pseudohongiellaceae bacterium]
MTYLFTPPELPVVPVTSLDALFPVHRIYCVGQNYSDHVREMGGDSRANPPVFFSKPADAVVTGNAAVPYPQATSDLHHEVELVVALGSGGRDIALSEALACVFGYAVGIDFTRRDLQALAKQAGKPWDTAKGFDASAPVSDIVPVHDQHPQQGAIWLEVNGQRRQQADISEMIWSVPDIIVELSKFYALCAGDLIFTGTPAGVAATVVGDHIEAGVDGVGNLAFDIIAMQD